MRFEVQNIFRAFKVQVYMSVEVNIIIMTAQTNYFKPIKIELAPCPCFNNPPQIESEGSTSQVVNVVLQ